MNLFEKLSPEHQQMMFAEQAEFPHLTKRLIKELNDNRFPTDITISSALSIFSILKAGHLFDISEFLDLFL